MNTFKTGIRLLVFVEGEDFSADLSTEICVVTEESSKSERNGSETMRTLAKKSSRSVLESYDDSFLKKYGSLWLGYYVPLSIRSFDVSLVFVGYKKFKCLCKFRTT